MKLLKLLISIVSVAILSACALLHFLAPAAQNQLQQNADFIGWKKIGEDFSSNNGYYGLDVDSHGTPYVIMMGISDSSILYKFDGKWSFVCSNLPFVQASASVLRIGNDDNPYVAYLDFAYNGVLQNFYGPAAVSVAAGEFTNGVEFFDYVITTGGRHIVSYRMTNFGVVTIHQDTGFYWEYAAPFMEHPPVDPLEIHMAAAPNDEVFILYIGATSNELYYSQGGMNIISLTGPDMQFAIGGNRIFYVFATMTSYYELKFMIKDIGAPSFISNDALDLHANAYFAHPEDTIVATKQPPYQAFCLLEETGSTAQYILQIKEDFTLSRIELPPVDGTFNDAFLFAGRDGSIYLLIDYSDTNLAINKLSVYRYYY